jgi:hypothetical protein
MLPVYFSEGIMPSSEYMFLGQAYVHAGNQETLSLQLLNEEWEIDADRGRR